MFDYSIILIIVCYSRILATKKKKKLASINHHHHIHQPPPSQSQLYPDVLGWVPNMEDLSRTGKAGWDLNPPTGAGMLSRQVRSGKRATFIHRPGNRVSKHRCSGGQSTGIWDGKSQRQTDHCLRKAKPGIKVHVTISGKSQTRHQLVGNRLGRKITRKRA